MTPPKRAYAIQIRPADPPGNPAIYFAGWSTEAPSWEDFLITQSLDRATRFDGGALDRMDHTLDRLESIGFFGTSLVVVS